MQNTVRCDSVCRGRYYNSIQRGKQCKFLSCTKNPARRRDAGLRKTQIWSRRHDRVSSKHGKSETRVEQRVCADRTGGLAGQREGGRRLHLLHGTHGPLPKSTEGPGPMRTVAMSPALDSDPSSLRMGARPGNTLGLSFPIADNWALVPSSLQMRRCL